MPRLWLWLERRARALISLMCLVLFVTGCANQPSRQQLALSDAFFRAGDIPRALASFEAAYKNQNPKDTTYFLEQGYLSRFSGQAAFSQSSLTLLEADRVINRWEDRATLNLVASLSDFADFIAGSSLSDDAYDPKDFEKSMLSYTLTLNHALAGRMDLAAIEARKMAEREKLIERTREKQIEAVRARQSETERNEGTAFAGIKQIAGYPVRLIDFPAANALKNAYQSAAAHYLAGFVFESRGDTSLAAPGYRLAAELKPDVPLFQNSLLNLDKPRAVDDSSSGRQSDTLIVVESGFVPRVVSHSSTVNFPTRRGARLVTVRLPLIDPNPVFHPVQRVGMGTVQVPLHLAANLDVMSRRQLHDDMPAYVFKAFTQAIVQIAAQEAVERAVRENAQKKGRNNDFEAALAGLLVGAALSVGDVDVRSWTRLPSMIYMGRERLDKGSTVLTIATPVGPLSVPVELTDDYEVVYVRVFNQGARVLGKLRQGELPTYLRKEPNKLTPS